MYPLIQYLRTFSRTRRDADLTLVYDGKEQLKDNPFTHQLFLSVKENFNLSLVKAQELSKRDVPTTDGQLVLVISRLRNWRSFPGRSTQFFCRSKVFFYDQDPWEAYHDHASCRGIYEDISEKVNPEAFLVTSPWWAEYIRRQSFLPVHFVRMGILPKYCSHAIPFGKKIHKIGFQGTVHSHRMAFYDRVRARGFDVNILPRKPFFTFLRDVQSIGVFLYNDQTAIEMNGSKCPLHGLWGKCLTVAGRGCFVIRNHDLAYDGYAIEDLPAVHAFKSEDEIPELIEMIINRPDLENDRLIEQTIAILKDRDDWQTVSNVLRRPSAQS